MRRVRLGPERAIEFGGFIVGGVNVCGSAKQLEGERHQEK